MRDPRRWSNFVSLLGGASLVAGSLDPMEGSVLVLSGSALLAVGSYLGESVRRRALVYRAWSFVLIAVGVAALFWLSAIGGIGGSSGRSAWWALLVLPYFVGWSLDVWGPGAARWISLAGIIIGSWYLAIPALMLRRTVSVAQRSMTPALILALIGICTIVACAARLLLPRRADGT